MDELIVDKRLTALAKSLPSSVPFVGPEAQERARGEVFSARLGANESVFGPSPRAISAMEAAAREAWQYADPEAHDLRHALATHHGVPVENVFVGEGIDGILGLLVRLTVEAETPVVTSAGAYPTFNYHVDGFGGAIHKVPYRADSEDPVALISAATAKKARLVYWANPDNPMGTWHGAGVVERTIKHVPDNCLLVLDEAYIDTAPEGTAPPLDPSNPRVIRMRTFSKAYGLAGARVGYAIGPERIISAFDKVRNHFGMSRISQAAALAALEDQAHLADVTRQVAWSRAELYRIARENDLKAIPSATNFVTIDCGGDGDFARAVLASLLAQGIFVRMPGVAPLDRCIRISCGGEAEMAALAEALPRALEAAR
ncbi:MAG: pyridoxal phosphate-dependent aminotransferase [Rhodobacteraceae bacterium]|nr:pyridoxal phosphate-dependent aminotransferase [Paracoccaceae bacterium]